MAKRIHILGPSSLLLLLVVISGGCSIQLMPTPNLYAHGVDPFPNVPEALQSNHVQVLFLTDRQPENADPAHRVYGYKRSRSVAFGVSDVEFGKDVSWEDLCKASRTAHRAIGLPVTTVRTEELGRFPPTPETLIEPLPSPGDPKAVASPPPLSAEVSAKMVGAEALLSAALAKTPDKEVDVFVHGYNNTFDDSVETIAQVWHFLGRRGVPVAYSWPAGHGGLRGYTYDRESSEFTVYHLKQMLRAIAANPDVKKINIISHSRGTDVVCSALRELHLEITAGGKSTRQELKLGTLVMAAPDMDTDVVIQRMVAARLGRVPERFVLYICSRDKALAFANWLFGGMNRLGKLHSDMFTPEELHTLRQSKTVQIVDAHISDAGSFGHNYFYASPAVSSDLILLMRYNFPPGEKFGRPLDVVPEGFWQVGDNYPTPAPTTQELQTADNEQSGG